MHCVIHSKATSIEKMETTGVFIKFNMWCALAECEGIQRALYPCLSKRRRILPEIDNEFIEICTFAWLFLEGVSKMMMFGNGRECW